MNSFPLLTGQRGLKIGFFGTNCSSSRTMTQISDRWSGTWEDNLRFAKLLDSAGMDFLLPIARWKGYGGVTDYQGETLETLTWATSLLAATEHLTIFATVHAPLYHPLVASKQIVTGHHVGRGRLGLNVVCGWNEDEFAMFGVDRRDHAGRYRHGQEWLDVVKGSWEKDDFDFSGEFFDLKGIRLKPKPYGGIAPLLMNAGASPDGRAFALRNCGAFFTGVSTTKLDDGGLHSAITIVSNAKAEAASYGRDIDVYTTAAVICRPTLQQAFEFEQYYTANAEWSIIDDLAARLGPKGKQPDEQRERLRNSFVNGHSSIRLLGTPDDIADGLARISTAGFAGVGINFVNYLDEFPLFRDEVVPRLERLGVRRARADAENL